MPSRLRPWVCAVVLLALACASPASTQERFGAKPRPKQEEGVQVPPMRGPEKPDLPAPPPPIVLASPLRPSVMPDTAPRIGGLSSQAIGGGQCRTSCARSYYRCLSGDDMSTCGPGWSRCLVACPDVTSSE